jgi:3-deoxy-7-phosphoheptulonate synthase
MKNFDDSHDINIASIRRLPLFDSIKNADLNGRRLSKELVVPSRQVINKILRGEDPRILFVTGPCSIHRPSETIEYAKRLAPTIKRVSKHICVVFRAVLSKPRTSFDWSGYFQEPDLDGIFNLEKGWVQGRAALIDILSCGVVVGGEALSDYDIQVTDDLMSLWWVGARTVTSPSLRRIASGLSAPTGFKNATDGRIEPMIEAIDVALRPAAFPSVSDEGFLCQYNTRGNPNSFPILRGSDHGSNYDEETVTRVVKELCARDFPIRRVVVDVSHGNSRKDYTKQGGIVRELVARIASGDQHIAGVMHESNMLAGKQLIPKYLPHLESGKSVTDGCVSAEETEETLMWMFEALKRRKIKK